MITDYASLKTAVGNWLARTTDNVFVEEVPTFIQLGERHLMKKLRVREMVCEARSDLNEECEWLPSGFQDIDFVNVLDLASGTIGNGDAVIAKTTPLTYADNERFHRYDTLSERGRPKHYTILGERIRFKPYPSVDAGEESGFGFELSYFGEWTPLSEATGETTNAILGKFSDLYLWSALIQAEGFIIDDQRIAVWKGQLEAGIAEANWASEQSEYGTMAISMPH